MKLDVHNACSAIGKESNTFLPAPQQKQQILVSPGDGLKVKIQQASENEIFHVGWNGFLSFSIELLYL